MSGKLWYSGYDELQQEVETMKQQYAQRCRELGVGEGTIREELWREMVARIVHESNWQEDLYLEIGRTQELADAAFDDPILIAGPHLDMIGIAEAHRKRVVVLKQQGRTVEDIAAYNLSRAHEAIH
jgi:hypothetical protein